MENPSRLYRWMVLLASLVTIAYLVGAAVHENFLAQWRRIQNDYRSILREKATDDRGRKLLTKFRVELKQVSVPGLNTMDRCVTCHNGIDDPRMTDVPRPIACIRAISSTNIRSTTLGAQCVITGKAPRRTSGTPRQWMFSGTTRCCRRR